MKSEPLFWLFKTMFYNVFHFVKQIGCVQLAPLRNFSVYVGNLYIEQKKVKYTRLKILPYICSEYISVISQLVRDSPSAGCLSHRWHG